MMSGAKKRVPKRRFKEFLNAGDWEQRKLIYIFNDFIVPMRDKPKVFSGTTPWTRIEDIEGRYINTSLSGQFVSDEIIKSMNLKVIPRGSLIVSASATFGVVAIVTNDLITNQTFIGLVPNKDFDIDFLYSLFEAPTTKGKLLKLSAGSTIFYIARESFENLVLSVPSKEEQIKISKVFKSIDDSITLHQRKLDKLQATKKALLQEMFPEEGQDKPKRRFKGFTDAWEQRKLGDIVDFLDGQRKPLKESDRIKGKYPYYGASGIIDYINDYLFDENLVLLSEDGANIIDRNYPVCFIATGKYWVNNHAHVLKAKAGVIDKFICESLERLDYTKFNTGTAQPKLNQDICQKIVITIPNEDEQKCISEFLNRINNIITLHQRKLDKLKNLKQAYLNEMFV